MSTVWARARSAVGRLREVSARLDRQHGRIADLERELVRIGPQVAALQEQVERLRRRLDEPAYAADEAEQAQARSLVEEVRAEHARVRARITAATVFEERLRVLEEKAQREG